MCYVGKFKSKKGTEFIALVINGVYVSMEYSLIDKVLRKQNSSVMQACCLDVGGKILIEDVSPDDYSL